MTVTALPWSSAPKDPGLYAMYGGDTPRTWVAYAGQAGNIAQRLTQHLYRRDSSVTTGVSAVGLNVDHVTQVAWWCTLCSATRTAAKLRSLLHSAFSIRRLGVAAL
jgi:hypothetical protein